MEWLLKQHTCAVLIKTISIWRNRDNQVCWPLWLKQMKQIPNLELVAGVGNLINTNDRGSIKNFNVTRPPAPCFYR